MDSIDQNVTAPAVLYWPARRLKRLAPWLIAVWTVFSLSNVLNPCCHAFAAAIAASDSHAALEHDDGHNTNMPSDCPEIVPFELGLVKQMIFTSPAVKPVMLVRSAAGPIAYGNTDPRLSGLAYAPLPPPRIYLRTSRLLI